MKNLNRVIAFVPLALLLNAAVAAQVQPQKPVTTPKPAATPAAPVGSSGAATTPRADASTDYRLVPGDKLRIEVYKEEQLSQSLQIRPDGKITLPLIGDVPAAGVTPRELTATITERLREFVKTTPFVTVIVAEAVPPMVYVLGEVNAPGAQAMSTPLTVLQALSLAGGFKEFANPKKIRILRKRPDGRVETILFNYKEAIESTGRPMMLQADDTVIVP